MTRLNVSLFIIKTFANTEKIKLTTVSLFEKGDVLEK